MVSLPESFPDRLKILRERNDLTQAKLAEIIGVHYMTISDYEHDKRQPGAFILCCLADYFHVTTDYLLGRSDRR